MQALLELCKVLFLDYFCLNVRYYTVNENELQMETSQWIYLYLTYVLHDILYVFIGIEIIFPLNHKAVCTTNITNMDCVDVASMLPIGV